MSKRIITISREFGSGGRTIGKMIAENLGIGFYDKELIERVAGESGLSKQYIEEHGEYSPSKSIFSYSFVYRDINGISIQDYLFDVQRKIILQIAENESCVIVGRCADYILKDRTDCLNVFIHADINSRAERIVKLYGETDKEPLKRLSEKDKKRKINYKYYTDQDWGKAINYDITLCSSTIGIEKCADIISELAK